ncbi:MAG: hypothetical protein ACD_79C00255G0002 [uncultured bacterium]|nr:MAG: hypothetical protein ACD_79C00255G0002 [uncultured bacterium]
MDTLKAIYDHIINIFVLLGCPKQTVFIIPIFFILLILGVFFKLFIKAFFEDKTKNIKQERIATKISDIIPANKTPAKKNESTDASRFTVRHFDRVPLNIKTSFIHETSDEKVNCTLHDVSLSGLGFSCAKEMKEGSRVKIFLPNLDKQSNNVDEFSVSGEIVRVIQSKSKNYEYGIKFFHVFTKECELLQLIIRKFN